MSERTTRSGELKRPTAPQSPNYRGASPPSYAVKPSPNPQREGRDEDDHPAETPREGSVTEE